MNFVPVSGAHGDGLLHVRPGRELRLVGHPGCPLEQQEKESISHYPTELKFKMKTLVVAKELDSDGKGSNPTMTLPGFCIWVLLKFKCVCSQNSRCIAIDNVMSARAC